MVAGASQARPAWLRRIVAEGLGHQGRVGDVVAAEALLGEVAEAGGRVAHRLPELAAFHSS